MDLRDLRRRTVGLAGLALIGAAVAGGTAFYVAARDFQTEPVVVATVALAPGSIVTPNDAHVVDEPTSSVQAGAIPATQAHELFAHEVVAVPIPAGAPILTSELAPRSSGVALSLEPASLPLNLAPGDTVDIFAPPSGSTTTAAAQQPEPPQPDIPLATGVPVLAVDPSSGSGSVRVEVAVPLARAAQVAAVAASSQVVLALAAPSTPVPPVVAVRPSESTAP